MTISGQRIGKITAFTNDDDSYNKNSIFKSLKKLFQFVIGIAQEIRNKWKTVLFLTPVFLGYTRGGKNILSCLGWSFDPLSIPFMNFELCGKCTYSYIALSSALAISILILAAIFEAQSIRSIADISIDESITNISSTIIVLIFGTYCLVEVLFGVGEGYNWASDFVVAFVAVWALRLIFSWDDHSRKIAGENERAKEEKEAEREVASFGDEWFVT